MNLTIVTINYNSSDNTIKLLKSLAKQTGKDFQTIVVDNASEETDFNILKNYCSTPDVEQSNRTTSQVVLLRNEQNLGFSGGNNIGIKKALENKADWIILLNPDTWVDNTFIVSIKAKLSHMGGVVGIPLVEGDRTAYRGKIEWLRSTLRHIYNPAYADYLRKNTNYYAIGGAMAIHKSVFDKIGFFDEKYFLYFEDADFSIKARKAGIAVNFLDEPKVSHQVSASTKKLGSPFLLRYHYRNALYFNLKNGPWYIKILVWLWSFWVVIKQLVKVMIYHNPEQSAAILKGVFDFYRKKYGKI